MSYCRWSCDNWKSDVYVYESDQGFVTHVASNRVDGEVPEGPRLIDLAQGKVTVEEYRQHSQRVSRFLDRANRKPIGLPRDGKTFTVETAQECADLLLIMRSEGYHIPQHAIDGLLEDADLPRS